MGGSEFDRIESTQRDRPAASGGGDPRAAANAIQRSSSE